MKFSVGLATIAPLEQYVGTQAALAPFNLHI
jgi:hypothetical protein